MKRATGDTTMNAESSRSHAICTIHVTVQDKVPGHGIMKLAKINLVDLAGSERIVQTMGQCPGTPHAMKETCQINRGLHALSKVISALSPDASGHTARHVPYRDSKLTRLLQDSLGGSARTLMIACISAADEHQHETLSTLQYAARARRIQNIVICNQERSASQASSLLNEIHELQWRLLQRHLNVAGLQPIDDILLQVLGPHACCCLLCHLRGPSRSA
jgi:Kinesin motor domain